MPELLEPILWNLPNTDLIVLQRVNSLWRDVIKQAHFQKKLCMEAEVCQRDKVEGKIRWNPVLQWAGAELDRDEEDECFVFCNEFCRHFLRRQNTTSVSWRPRDGSWQRMHITEPSGTQVTIARDDMKWGSGMSSYILSNADGVNLGQLS